MLKKFIFLFFSFFIFDNLFSIENLDIDEISFEDTDDELYDEDDHESYPDNNDNDNDNDNDYYGE